MTFNLNKMRKLQYTITLLIAMLICKNTKAQLPYNDTAWVLQAGLSDDFTGSSINTTLWDTSYNYWNGSAIFNVNNGAEWDFGKNDSVGGGYLYIKADTLKPNKVAAWGTFPPYYNYATSGQPLTYAYQGGVITSKYPGAAYTFGYIEIRAKFPSKKWPLWPAFWMQYSRDSLGHSYSYYNEIDIAENDAPKSDSGYQIGNNWWVSADSSSPYVSPTTAGGNDINVLSKTDSLSGAFHTYSVEWNPTRFTYYFDHVPTTTVYDPTGVSIPQHAMNVILNFCVDPYYAKLPANWNGKQFSGIHPPSAGDTINHGNKFPTKWPQYFQIDYVHYYKLTGGNAGCSTAHTICTPNYADREVYQSINVGGGSCTPTYNPTNNAGSYTLRATDFVELDAGTTINTPTGPNNFFAIEITTCP